MTYEASKDITGKHPVPCLEYDKDCTGCSEENLPPHCGRCGYVKEDHEEGE